MKIPYGTSNFGQIREEGYFYADKTPFLQVLEAGYRHVVFLRPRRFGKSTLVSLLEHYYDLGRKDRFDDLFQGLWVHQHPTEVVTSGRRPRLKPNRFEEVREAFLAPALLIKHDAQIVVRVHVMGIELQRPRVTVVFLGRVFRGHAQVVPRRPGCGILFQRVAPHTFLAPKDTRPVPTEQTE